MNYSRLVGYFHTEISEYSWAPIAEAPLPHYPYKMPAAFKASFEAAMEAPTRVGRVLEALADDDTRKARRRKRLLAWREGLTADRLAGWDYLDMDWGNALAIAAEVLATVRPWTSGNVYRATDDLDIELRRASRSLLIDPIWWRPQDDEVSDGQHRLLAMRVQGVDRFLYAL